MDKNAIKKYAVWARREFIEKVSQKALQYGIEEGKELDPKLDSINGVLLSDDEKKQRQALIRKINENGYTQVIEEVAYTWFNRFIALRFMEVNGYLPSHVRVFTDEAGGFNPQIMSEVLHLDIEGLDMEKVYELKNDNRDDDLFKYLLITQCNALSGIFPKMFQKIADYTELLLPDYLLRDGSVIEQMVNQKDGIPEADWQDQVQIIGWLYQYYNTEPKDKVFADLKKNIKITKETIPAATQLFTPDWIVHYMVENSLGRLWLEGHPNDSLKKEWKYYLDETEQEPDVQKQLEEIRKEYAGLKPEEIKCIDPCMGSGHILCVLFDTLIKIYEDYGYPARDAAASIVENNLWGLDIDERAAQLAYFAVMMKARQYDRRFLTRGIQPHVYAIEESNGLKYDGDYGDFLHEKNQQETLTYMFDAFKDAKEYGSILSVEQRDYDSFLNAWELTAEQSLNDVRMMGWYMYAGDKIYTLANQAKVLSQKYDVVVTNPPYMGSSGMAASLLKYVRKHFYDGKTDLFAVFISRGLDMLLPHGYQAMVTMQSWMYLSTFNKLREEILEKDVVNLIRIGYNSFPEMNSQVAHACAFSIRNSNINDYLGKYYDLNTGHVTDDKDKVFMERKATNSCYIRSKSDFHSIPGLSFAFALSKKVIEAFATQPALSDVGTTRLGMTTADNNRFTRFWYEVDIRKCIFNAKNEEEVLSNNKKWVPYNKGGKYRKWYGNLDVVVNWENSGFEIKNFADDKGHIRSTVPNTEYYFRQCATWSKISTDTIAFRYRPVGSIFDVAGACLFSEQGLYELLAFCNSKVAIKILNTLSPTLNFEGSQIASLPIVKDVLGSTRIEELSKENVAIVKTDWDAYETSWDFLHHPLIPVGLSDKSGKLIKEIYKKWENDCLVRYNKLVNNEESLNQIFIDMYGLSDELNKSVPEKEISLKKADALREIKSLISYAVGCMFGRYSLDVPGLVYAGGPWENTQYKSYCPDKDAIIPICDDEYFEDDIVGRFISFVDIVYGKDTLEDNLTFIADTLGGKGTSRDVIRNYFINDFYADHVKIYQKRPIYWLFDSGKKNGFKCLIYMHRYQSDTIARIRTDYVHEQQARYRTAIEEIEKRIDTVSASEKVKLTKKLNTLKAQDEEIHTYEEKIHHLADQMICIDLDDGVKHNYALFQDVLAKIK